MMINKLVAVSAFALFVSAGAHATHTNTEDFNPADDRHMHWSASDLGGEVALSRDAFDLVQTVPLSYARSYDLGVGSGGGDPWPLGIGYFVQSALSLEQDMLRQNLFAQFGHLKKRNWNPDKGSLAQLALSALLKPAVDAEDECTDLPHVIANNFVENLHKGWQCATILLYLPGQGLTSSLETTLSKALESRIGWLQMLESVDHSHHLALRRALINFDASQALASLTPFVPLVPLEAREFVLPTLSQLTLSADLSHHYIKEEEGEAQSDA